jgi:methionyl-tRNA formyltransferase
MRIVVLTIKTPGNVFLANRLSGEFEIAGLVLLREKQRSTRELWEFWLRQVQKHGVIKTSNKYLYLKLAPRRTAKESNKESPAACESFDARDDYTFSTETMETIDINSDEVVAFITSRAPDVIAVCGSKVLKPRVFNLAPCGTVNIHCGITPHYRSANPVEWAVYNRDFNRIGVTIHFVNEGVDTGNIIYQQTIPVKKGDGVDSLYYRSIVAGSELMVKAIRDIEAGRVSSRPVPANGGRHYLAIEYGFKQAFQVNRILKSL